MRSLPLKQAAEPARRRAFPALALALAAAACAPHGPPDGPNVLVVLWDTVRADRLGLYGHEAPTTPFLDAWARDARVFEDCTSTANSTMPSHASLFTGLLPSEHGAHNGRPYLDDRFTTLAELVAARGWHTFLWSANPYVSAHHNLAQGFEVEQHPWDAQWRERALAIVRDKLEPEEGSTELPDKLARGEVKSWGLHATGALAGEALGAWLDGLGDGAPWFAFLNYMEAHRPLLPARRYRERFLDADGVARSYRIDRSWETLWRYDFGLHDYPEEDLAVLAATYDAALAELDDLLRELLEGLDAAGRLDDTIVVLTADHGEHLGEHHLLDHQYSLYDELLRVPLVIRVPEELRDRLPPGREPAPVEQFDLRPTLLELLGIDAGRERPLGPRALDAPLPERTRLAEQVAPFPVAIKSIRALEPDWDPTPFERSLRALQVGGTKLIWSSDGRHELYEVGPGHPEREELGAARPELEAAMLALLEELVGGLDTSGDGERALDDLSPEQRDRLGTLGYAED